MLRLRWIERIVEPDYAMDRHKTMTPAVGGCPGVPHRRRWSRSRT